MSKEEALKVFGLTDKSTLADLKKIFVQQAKEWHPDVSSAPEAQRKFAHLNEAYQVLSNILAEKGTPDLDADAAAEVAQAYEIWMSKNKLAKELAEKERQQSMMQMIILAVIFFAVFQGLALVSDRLPIDRSYRRAWGDKYDEMLEHFRVHRFKKVEKTA